MAATPNTIALNSQASFTAFIFCPGLTTIEIFTNLPSGNTIDLLTNSAKFINNQPDVAFYSNAFSFFPNLPSPGFADLYGARLSAWFTPPTNGVYKFYLRSDDGSQLLMNTNGADRAGRVQILTLTAFTSAYTAATNVTLTGGQRYYMEALLKEGIGGDGIGIAMRVGTDLTVPATTEYLDATFFSQTGNPDTNTVTTFFTQNPSPASQTKLRP